MLADLIGGKSPDIDTSDLGLPDTDTSELAAHVVVAPVLSKLQKLDLAQWPRLGPRTPIHNQARTCTCTSANCSTSLAPTVELHASVAPGEAEAV